MRYLVKATYTDDDPKVDRRRKAIVVETDKGVMGMLFEAVSTLEIVGLWDDIQKDYLESSEEDDTSEGWSWITFSNDGQWDFEWRPFESDDPVTPETLKAWAMAQDETSAEEAWVGVLANIMGRWYWQTIDEWGSFDLKQALHDIVMDGCSTKGYNEMTGDELLLSVMAGPVEATRYNFCEEVAGVPFGLAMMVQWDTALWLDGQEPDPDPLAVERQDLDDNGDEI